MSKEILTKQLFYLSKISLFISSSKIRDRDRTYNDWKKLEDEATKSLKLIARIDLNEDNQKVHRMLRRISEVAQDLTSGRRTGHMLTSEQRRPLWDKLASLSYNAKALLESMNYEHPPKKVS